VLVSSDKAVNPTSIMGCTKHVAERVVHEYSNISSTRFVVVRFGNVLGSAGSVIPVFQRQIERGGPITITDSRMTRFFMSIPEAAQLVMQSAAMCRGGEIYVLDMGEQVSIVQLAEDLISLSGLPRHSIEIEFTGIRKGEKLYEELYFHDEVTIPTEHYKVRAARPRSNDDSFSLTEIDLLVEKACKDGDSVREHLEALVPSFKDQKLQPLCDGNR
jgi:FlaA1/EpsC-like NDP-sugar epimerase